MSGVCKKEKGQIGWSRESKEVEDEFIKVIGGWGVDHADHYKVSGFHSEGGGNHCRVLRRSIV